MDTLTSVEEGDSSKALLGKLSGDEEADKHVALDGSKCLELRKAVFALDVDIVSSNTEYEILLFRAATVGDWMAGMHILDKKPGLLAAPFSSQKMTLIHVAAASSHGASFLRKLVDYMDMKGVPLTAIDVMQQNALHYAARSGNLETAQILVGKDASLAKQQGGNSFPIQVAAQSGHKNLVSFFLEQDPQIINRTVRTADSDSGTADPDNGTADPDHGTVGPNVLVHLILSGLYDDAIDLLDKNPSLAVKEDYYRGRGETALLVLANKPEEFRSGSRHTLTFWQRGVTHNNILKLVKTLIKKILDCTDPEANVDKLMGLPALAAARGGIHEFVVELIKAYPFVVLYTDTKDRNLFDYAVMHRQHKVFNLFFELGSWKGFVRGYDVDQCNMLHHAANWSEPARSQISKIAGAALQMQRELQWFKKVQEVVQSSYKFEYIRYKDEQSTPDKLFTESHKELLKEGKKWMKKTAESYTIAAALILTIAFAAAFTVPGGTNEKTGLPIFLRDQSFMIFAISNVLAFFFSSTSLLMFLGILTSRHSQQDFLTALPVRLVIGQICLFLSITSMLVAFTAGIHVMLSDRVSWIGIPASCLAFLSGTLFIFFQGPLLVKIVFSTFGPSIFGQKSKELRGYFYK